MMSSLAEIDRSNVVDVDLGSADRTELPEITTLGLAYQPLVRGSVVL